jgi:hypothetical protein
LVRTVLGDEPTNAPGCVRAKTRYLDTRRAGAKGLKRATKTVWASFGLDLGSFAARGKERGSTQVELRLPPGSRPIGIALVAFSSSGFFIRVAEVQFGMVTLGLQHLGPLVELARFTAKD